MRVSRHATPMTALDLRAIAAARTLRGTSHNAGRIVDSLAAAAERKEPMTVRQRHALYAICWRFRRQIPMALQVQVTIALAEAKAAAEEFRMNEPDPIRSFRAIDGNKTKAVPQAIEDLFANREFGT